MRAQFRGCQYLGKEQAQNSSEGKKSAEGGQYPAPPTGPKTSGVGIAKDLIDLLLDHDVSAFKSLDGRENRNDSANVAQRERMKVPVAILGWPEDANKSAFAMRWLLR
jgi:hypothetical protein